MATNWKQSKRKFHGDGYINLLNKYGTKQDNTEAYTHVSEPFVPDKQLADMYVDDGLFAKIIDAPAQEAVKHGYELGIIDEEIKNFISNSLDDLDWEESFSLALSWSRLFGGSIIVMILDDGRLLEEPVDWDSLKGIEELKVYDRSCVTPDTASLYRVNSDYSKYRKGSSFGKPEFYYVSSREGSFCVHESRCLVFKNGRLPELCTNMNYWLWGLPEFVRIKRILRQVTTSHENGCKLLERCVQAVYGLKNLSQMMATDEGEGQVLKRLGLIDTARGILNTIAIDSDGESYEYKTTSFSGIKEILDSAFTLLSAITNIPQTVFGRSPAGLNSTGESDMENFYNYVDRYRKTQVKPNLMYLIDIVLHVGLKMKKYESIPEYKFEFEPLWNMSEAEKANIEQTKAQTALTKAQTTQSYVDMQVLDPTEVRKGLAKSGEYVVEELLDDYDSEEELMANMPQIQDPAELLQDLDVGGQEDNQSITPDKQQKIQEK